MSGTNSDIYDTRLTAAYPWEPFNHVPYSTYFYYLTLDENKRPRVVHYFYVDGPRDDPAQWQPIPPSRIPALVAELAANARAGGGSPPASGSNFQDIVWTRKSHLVILVDEEAWELRRRAEGGAVAFNTSKDSTPNHSFFDARDLEIEIPAGGNVDTRRAIALINHMKRNSDGDDLQEGEVQWFAFDIYLDVEYAGSSGSKLTIILDPDGQNQGPPV